MKRFLVSMLLAWLVASVAASTGLVSQGSSPEIVFIDFPKQIPADGSKVSGFVGFKDPDGDLSRAEFTVVQAKDFQPFTLDLRMLRGTKEGVFEFTLSTTTAQQVVLRVTLVDEAGNRSQPQEFSFEAIGIGAILQVSPTSLSFSSEVGRNPPSQTIQITNAGSGTLSWSASADQPWIGLNPSSGMAPSTVTVSISAASILAAAGSYSGQITVSAPGAQGSPVTVLVSLTLSAPQRPAVLEVNPARLDFQGYEGGNDPATQSITIRNTGEQPLSWTAQADASWVRVGLSRGELPPGASQSVAVSVRLVGLSAGDRQAGIIITAPGAQGSPVRVVVTLRVKSRLVRTLTGHTGNVRSVAFSPDGRLLASGSNDNMIKLWEVASGRELHTLRGHNDYVTSVAFSPDGRFLASSSWDKTVKLWEVVTGRWLTRFEHENYVTSIAFSPDGQLLASGSYDRTIKLWEVHMGREVRTFFGHTGWVTSVAFSLDGQLLASGSQDGTIKFWEVANGKELRFLRFQGEILSVAFSPDWQLLALPGFGGIELWEVATGNLVRTLSWHTLVHSVVFSPDGRLLASSSYKEIKLWDVSDLTGR
jgi:WD40 repeat protein